MGYRIIKRNEYGLPSNVTGSTGAPRPAISNCQYLTCHYTGANVAYKQRSTPAEILKIQAMFASTKPFEYNWVIGHEDDDAIYEYAGNYRAAHSAGENHTAHGVLMLLGINETPTPRMINKFRWLRDHLLSTGGLSSNVQILPHKDMPVAATACPGANILAVWNQFLGITYPDFEPTPPNPPLPPNPPDPEDEEMTKLVLVDHRNNNVYLVDAASKTWVRDWDAYVQLTFRIKESKPGSDPATQNIINGTALAWDGYKYNFRRHGGVDVVASYGPIVGSRPPGVDEYGR